MSETRLHGGTDASKLELIPKFFQLIKGRSVADIESAAYAIQEPAVLQGGTSAAVAMSSLEQCLWDLQGKILSIPAYDLFGGRLRESVRNYANINRSTAERTPEGFARQADAAIKAGFDAIKLAPSMTCRTISRTQFGSRSSQNWESLARQLCKQQWHRRTC